MRYRRQNPWKTLWYPPRPPFWILIICVNVWLHNHPGSGGGSGDGWKMISRFVYCRWNFFKRVKAIILFLSGDIHRVCRCTDTFYEFNAAIYMILLINRNCTLRIEFGDRKTSAPFPERTLFAGSHTLHARKNHFVYPVKDFVCPVLYLTCQIL